MVIQVVLILQMNIFNKIVKHGHWKDTGVRLFGEAVFELTALFLQNWKRYRPEKIDYKKYKPNYHYHKPFLSDSFVQCYGILL